MGNDDSKDVTNSSAWLDGLDDDGSDDGWSSTKIKSSSISLIELRKGGECGIDDDGVFLNDKDIVASCLSTMDFCRCCSSCNVVEAAYTRQQVEDSRTLATAYNETNAIINLFHLKLIRSVYFVIPIRAIYVSQNI